MPVSATISADLPWSTWPAVAMTPRVPGTSVLVEVVAFDRVQDRAGDVAHLLVGDRAGVQQYVVVVRPAEHRGRAVAQAPAERVRVRALDAHPPRVEHLPRDRPDPDNG